LLDCVINSASAVVLKPVHLKFPYGDKQHTKSTFPKLSMQDLTIMTQDQVKLACTYFPGRSGGSNKFIIINSATGVNQRYYKKYASFLAEKGYDVLTYDYRGIGMSRPLKLKGFEASFIHWGQSDFEGVLNYVSNNFRTKELYVIGHSVGGVLIGMTPVSSSVKGFICICAQMAYYKDWTLSKRYKLYFLWHIIIPLLTKILGYFPGKKLNMMEDIPKGVVMQWHLRRKMPSMGDQMEKAGYKMYFNTITSKIMNIGFVDDPIGTPMAISRLASLFVSADVKTEIIHPAEMGLQNIGHFGFFQQKNKDILWETSLQWLAFNEF
jgi:predicted alpha/beta hydrolase